jgi:hypothetical protein
MPYVEKKDRERIDPRLLPLLMEIGSPGELAYVLYRMLCYLTRPSGFATFSVYYGAAKLAVEEFKRRKIDPYEDGRREKNGDV